MSAPSREESIAEARDSGMAYSENEGKWVQGTKRKSKSREAEQKKQHLAKMIKSPTFEQRRSIAKHVDKEDKRGDLPHIKKMSPMNEIRHMSKHMMETKKGAIGKPSEKMKY